MVRTKRAPIKGFVFKEPYKPPFLRLPGELRNLIYSYALHEPEGLFYRDDRWHPQDDPSYTIPPNPQPKLYHSTSSALEANQLQYVNKQLRKETRALGIQHNDTITFWRYNGHYKKYKPTRSAEKECLDYLAACSNATKTKLATIVVFSNVVEELPAALEHENSHLCVSIRDCHRLIDCAFANPHIKFEYRTRYLSFGVHADFSIDVLWIVAIESMFRGRHELLDGVLERVHRGTAQEIRMAMQGFCRRKTVAELNAPNFRILPFTTPGAFAKDDLFTDSDEEKEEEGEDEDGEASEGVGFDEHDDEDGLHKGRDEDGGDDEGEDEKIAVAEEDETEQEEEPIWEGAFRRQMKYFCKPFIPAMEGGLDAWVEWVKGW